MRKIQILTRPFSPEDQAAAKGLILAGMAEYWGTVDESLNPDLNEIEASFTNGRFLVAVTPEGELVGTGAFLWREGQTAEIVRMSVATAWRRQGVASLLLNDLVVAARQGGARKIILETNASWLGARAFYERHGFVVTHYVDGDWGREVYFALDLA